uniref:CSON006539 protein n=2 Tax=Culicoides sonorensis TaxID=179676 RepID=A0A336LW63_CULSO
MTRDKRVYVLDGGFSTQLSVHVGNCVDGDALWSARFNHKDPEAVVKTHLDFLNAGADIILTNTYQASVEGYKTYLQLDEPQSLDLIRKTVGLAHTARDQFLQENQSQKTPLIAASIGPYGAHLHDGSEYSGSYADRVSPDTIKDWHRRRIAACIEAGVDMLAVETIPCLVEAEVLVDLICHEYPEVKFWVSFQCKDDSHIAHGEDFSESVSHIWNKVKEYKSDKLLAIGVNCLHPANVTPLFKSVNAHLSADDQLPLVVYPNSGELYDVKKGWYGKEDCVPLESYVPEWISLGAKFIGGCCRTYAADIKRIKESKNKNMFSPKKVYVLDGGLSTQLSVHVGDRVDGDPLWAARFNHTDPEAVVQTHLDFLNAGSDIIHTNTYQASVEGFKTYLHLDESQSLELIRKTVRFAHSAREKYLKQNPNQRTPVIAASIGPYGAHLHDGSEYSGKYADIVPAETIKNWHRPRITACIEAGVDMLAVQTIPCLVEADVLVDLLCHEYPKVKFWLSFQCKDSTHIAHGETFLETVSHIWNKIKEYKSDQLIAIGANCIHPKNVTSLFKSVKGHLAADDKLPFVIYPNSGELYDVKKGWYGKEDCVPLESYVPEWISLGAKFLGGCCRTYAADIKRIKECVQKINDQN